MSRLFENPLGRGPLGTGHRQTVEMRAKKSDSDAPLAIYARRRAHAAGRREFVKNLDGQRFDTAKWNRLLGLGTTLKQYEAPQLAHLNPTACIWNFRVVLRHCSQQETCLRRAFEPAFFVAFDQLSKLRC